VAACGAKGPAGQLAAHASFVSYQDGVLRLSLPPADELLRTPALVQQLQRCLADQLGRAPQIRFEAAPAATETLHQRGERQRDTRQAAAESAFLSDPHVQKLMREQGARLVPDSIRPLDD
ncbi:MAG TPA: DNA polymerase III subunit gamma/tau, partial [Xanthomonadaceae bacterium]|nr:DNA polymerase III subunit gamma/tau [Xanthomonadaceae bacterium]